MSKRYDDVRKLNDFLLSMKGFEWHHIHMMSEGEMLIGQNGHYDLYKKDGGIETKSINADDLRDLMFKSIKEAEDYYINITDISTLDGITITSQGGDC